VPVRSQENAGTMYWTPGGAGGAELGTSTVAHSLVRVWSRSASKHSPNRVVATTS
jgi:hypothetical protein